MAEFLRDFLDEVVVVACELERGEGGVPALKVCAFEPCGFEGRVPVPQPIEIDILEED